MSFSTEIESEQKQPGSQKELSVPFFLLLITLITYAPLIRQLGFYWDDWPMLWFELTQGPQGFLQAFTIDRPFLGYFYYLTAILFGSDPLVWQIVTVLSRWLVAWAFWWLLKQLWPGNRYIAIGGAILLTTYSGFKQMPIAYVWGNALILLFLYVLSYGLMLKAISHAENGKAGKYWLFTIIGVFCYTYCTLCTEYYTGLDLTRGIIIWIFLLRYLSFQQVPFWGKVKKTAFYWLPYLAVFVAFMFWRVFIFQFPSYQPVLMTNLKNNPLNAVLGLFERIVQDFYTATWGAWTEFFRFPSSETTRAVSDRLFWLIVLAGFVLIAGYLCTLHRRQKSAPLAAGNAEKWINQALLLSAAAVIFSGLPYVVTSLSPGLEFPYDRWLIVYMFGSVILLPALIAWFTKSPAKRILLISLFAAMAMGGNLLNANTFRRDWNNQQDFVDQLLTRIPDFQAPMYLLSDTNPLKFETDNSLTGMVNLALAPELTSELLEVSVGFYSTRFKDGIERLESSKPFYQGFRSAMFGAESKDVVVYYYNPPGCLRILDPNQHAVLPIFPEEYYDLISLSHPGKINSGERDAAFIQTAVFKSIPEDSWCRNFQKADLARQFEDWQTIAAIGDETLPRFSAGEASEYIPFIEAYGNLRRWQDMTLLVDKVHAMNHELDFVLCPILQKLMAGKMPPDSELFKQVQPSLFQIGCKMSEK